MISISGYSGSTLLMKRIPFSNNETEFAFS
jgi:hypothetical protein